jgi:hypothetical protein
VNKKRAALLMNLERAEIHGFGVTFMSQLNDLYAIIFSIVIHMNIANRGVLLENCQHELLEV